VPLARKVAREIKALCEDLAEGFAAECGKGSKGVQRLADKEIRVEAGNRQPEQIIHGSAAENAPKDRALDLLHRQDRDGDHGADGDKTGHDALPGCRAEQVEARNADQRCIVIDDDAGVLQTEERDEQTDACRDCRLDGCGNGIKDQLAQTRDREQNEDQTVHKNKDQGVCIRKAKAEADRVNKESIQSHAGRLRQRQVGKQTDQHRADDGGQRGRNVHGVKRNAVQICKHTGVDHQNVRHRHKGRDARNQFGANCGVVLFELKHVSSSNSKLCSLFNAESQPHTIADIQPLNRRILLYQKLLG